MEFRQTIEDINKAKNWFFQKAHKRAKSLEQIINKKGGVDYTHLGIKRRG